MESELSGIFRVKLVTKNIVRGSPGTQFMHMRVKKVKTLSHFSKEKNMSSYLTSTYHGNQASRKRDQFLFLNITQ